MQAILVKSYSVHACTHTHTNTYTNTHHTHTHTQSRDVKTEVVFTSLVAVKPGRKELIYEVD